MAVCVCVCPELVEWLGNRLGNTYEYVAVFMCTLE